MNKRYWLWGGLLGVGAYLIWVFYIIARDYFDTGLVYVHLNAGGMESVETNVFYFLYVGFLTHTSYLVEKLFSLPLFSINRHFAVGFTITFCFVVGAILGVIYQKFKERGKVREWNP